MEQLRVVQNVMGAPPERNQAADRGSIPRDCVGLAPLYPAHDGAGVVAQLALTDLVTHRVNHEASLASCATKCYGT